MGRGRAFNKEASMKVLVVFYSMYGHIYKMAEAIKQGVEEVKGAKAELRRVPETLPEEVLKMMGAIEAQKQLIHVPVCTVDELGEADAVIFGTPTRFGNMCGQMRQFLDATGKLWMNGSLVGKVGSVFTSSNTQHGGQGINHTEFSRNPPPPRHGDSRASLRLRRADAHGRNNRRLSVWSLNHSRGKRSARSERKRTQRSAVSGRSRGAVGAKLSK